MSQQDIKSDNKFEFKIDNSFTFSCLGDVLTIFDIKIYGLDKSPTIKNLKSNNIHKMDLIYDSNDFKTFLKQLHYYNKNHVDSKTDIKKIIIDEDETHTDYCNNHNLIDIKYLDMIVLFQLHIDTYTNIIIELFKIIIKKYYIDKIEDYVKSTNTTDKQIWTYTYSARDIYNYNYIAGKKKTLSFTSSKKISISSFLDNDYYTSTTYFIDNVYNSNYINIKQYITSINIQVNNHLSFKISLDKETSNLKIVSYEGYAIINQTDVKSCINIIYIHRKDGYDDSGNDEDEEDEDDC
jgi:hypothetical protein